MMLDTNGNIFPEGTYRFRVAQVPEETDVKGYKSWQFSFETQTDEGLQLYNERFMLFLIAPLMRGLAFKEVVPGKFDFEPTAALGLSITARIVHVTLDKGASAGKTVARMTDIQPVTKQAMESKAALNAQAPIGSVAADDIPF